MANISPPPMETQVTNRDLTLFDRWRLWINSLVTWVNGVSFQTTSVSFAASTSASVTISNQTWITAQSKITAQLQCPAGTAPSVFNALGLTTVVSAPTSGSVVITVFSPAPISGTYTLAVIGSS